MRVLHHSLAFLHVVTATVIFAASTTAQPFPSPFSCIGGGSSNATYAFCNTVLPLEQRARSIISLLTVEEKIAQLGDRAPAITRLGVPAYRWWSEGLHGVSNAGLGVYLGGPTFHAATNYPQVILTAAAFDQLLWYRIGKAIGIEARAIFNGRQAQGMTYWAPNINVFRDPRWGRGQETPGEDPATVSKYAVAYVRGLQGDAFTGGRSLTRLRASACCKHFTAYDLENWKGMARYIFDAQVTAQDLEDTFQPPFKSCVEEGKATGIMCSYNRVNGVPTCANHQFLTDTARGQWGFSGYVVSDCDAVSIIKDAQGYARTAEDAVADVLKAGMDLNCGDYVQKNAMSALQQGKITEADIDRALQSLFLVRMRLGLFDGDQRFDQFGRFGASEVCSARHRKLALEAARGGIVLLKNAAGRLPLSKHDAASIAVIGPNANNATLLLGNYAGPPCAPVTPLQGLQGYVRDVRFFAGCAGAACAAAAVDQAAKVASAAEHVVLFMGLDQDQEKEGLDRVDLTLPGMQRQLIAAAARAAKRPVILVLLSGGPLDVTFAKSDPKIGAILWAGYPGEAGGAAIADVIFGKHNPGGRLPVTWYPQDYTTKVAMTDMRMRPDKASGYPGRTYRFYGGETVFPFGHGLSYSRYTHRIVGNSGEAIVKKVNQAASAAAASGYEVEKMSAEACEGLKLSAVVRVTNEGPMDGRHPVMAFLRWPAAGEGRPRRQLIGFENVYLRSGGNAEVAFEVRPCEHLARVTENGKKVMDQGSHFVAVGDGGDSDEQLEVALMPAD